MDSGKGQPRLNLDTLRLICNSLTDVSDVLSFALTCSALKNDAFQRRLQMSPIVLTDGEAIDKFYDFIFADAAARAPHIYGLKLPDRYCSTERNSSPHETTDDRLVAVLKAAISLKYLRLSTAGLSNSVLSTVRKISTLQELFLCGGYQRGPFLKLLTTLRTPLRHLQIEEYITGDITARFLHNSLSHFAPTLEIFELADFPFNISSSSVMNQFPAMKSLKTEFIYGFENLGLLLRLFPNLDDTLSIQALSPTGNEFSAFRERSKTAQMTHTWPGLERVVCSAKAAYLLALQCPIRCMDLEGSITDPVDKHHVVEVLRHNAPRRLLLRLEILRGSSDALDGLFPSNAASKLTRLVLYIHVHIECREGYNVEQNSSWDQFMDNLIYSMACLSLTHVRIVFHYEVRRDKDTPPLTEVQGDSVYYAREEDLHPAALRLFSAIPSLQFAHLTTSGHTTLLNRTQSYRHTSRWLSSRAWRIPDIHKDLRPSNTEWWPCVEIGNEEADAVIDREELHLGRKEKAMLAFCGGSLSKQPR